MFARSKEDQPHDLQYFLTQSGGLGHHLKQMQKVLAVCATIHTFCADIDGKQNGINRKIDCSFVIHGHPGMSIEELLNRISRKIDVIDSIWFYMAGRDEDGDSVSYGKHLRGSEANQLLEMLENVGHSFIGSPSQQEKSPGQRMLEEALDDEFAIGQLVDI